MQDKKLNTPHKHYNHMLNVLRTAQDSHKINKDIETKISVFYEIYLEIQPVELNSNLRYRTLERTRGN